jgi:hypothetical protein
MNKLGWCSVVSLCMSFFFMAFEQEYRVFAYVFLGLFTFISFLVFALLKDRLKKIDFNKKVVFVFTLLLFLSILQVCVSYNFNDGIELFDVFRVIYSIFVFFGLVVAFSIWGVDWYSSKISLLIVLLTCVAFVLYFAGFNLDSMNFYASMLIIPAMYALLNERFKSFLILSFFVIFLGLVFEARGAYLVMVLFIIMYMVNKLVSLKPFVMLVGLLLLIYAQYYLLITQTLQADEILSYRPTIWKYYYLEGLENFWFGKGPILMYVSEGAASYYQSMIGRGVGVSYGTQSMYVLYFYESGFVGVFLLVSMFYMAFTTRSKYLVPVFAIAVLALMETVKIGAVSIYGLPLTYFLTISLLTGQSKNA